MLLIISGPSGVGKTTITHRVKEALDATFSISATTRPQTPDDVEGEDYFFVSETEFERMRDAGELLEWANVFDNYYGTPREPVERSLAEGRLVILEIDVLGALQVKRNMPQALAMFVLPPSEAELLQRLRNRQREDEATIQKRFSRAKDEIAHAKASGVYDVFIVNDDLDHAVDLAVAKVREHQAQQVT